MQRIAERLRQLRENADLKQKDVAEAIGVGLDAYKNYETARRSIPADVLREAARFFGYSMDYLSCLTDIPFALRSDFEELAEQYCTLTRYDQERIQERIMTMHERYKPHRTLKDRK
ncbi:MAG: helix-turn-helix transcriptional regulator [Firmicutes bacterium]|nr:helix-turn-helix transcriptional regulator [Bacillota bacterium]